LSASDCVAPAISAVIGHPTGTALAGVRRRHRFLCDGGGPGGRRDLRSLTAEALRWAHAQGPLFPVSLGVMAVANAFVMLGLLPELLAEAILDQMRP